MPAVPPIRLRQFHLRQRWLAVALALAAVFALLGGMAARSIYQRAGHGAAPVVLPSGGNPPGPPPGSPTVQLTPDAAGHPMHDAVLSLLQAYFDAINAKNYDAWRDTVTSQRLASTSRAEWLHNYHTTRDGSIVVYRIESGGVAALRVLLSFVSTQDPGAAPPDFPHTCIRWRVVFPLTLEGAGWKLDAGPTGASPQHDAC